MRTNHLLVIFISCNQFKIPFLDVAVLLVAFGTKPFISSIVPDHPLPPCVEKGISVFSLQSNLSKKAIPFVFLLTAPKPFRCLASGVSSTIRANVSSR